jgi:hypothetical protein
MSFPFFTRKYEPPRLLVRDKAGLGTVDRKGLSSAHQTSGAGRTSSRETAPELIVETARWRRISTLWHVSMGTLGHLENSHLPEC